jgi:hypothetical protein
VNASVVRFGGRRMPRSLAGLPELTLDELATAEAARLIVVGADADLGTVLSRLLKLDRLDVEVAYAPRWRTAATRAYGLPARGGTALTGTAHAVPLIRDELGNVLVGAASWVGDERLREEQRASGRSHRRPPAALHGEAVCDDTVLFDGDVAGIRIEPTREAPGLRATVLSGRMRPQGWVTGRAAQLGSTGAFVVRDGELSTRPVKRFAYYRHIADWRAVR